MLIASYLNSKATILAFCDPQFTIPTVLEGLFNKSVCLSGINRDTIAKMVTQAEARKFAVKHWNPYDLHKVVSGMHPNGFRQMMQSFSKHEDYNPENPSTAEELFKQIREMTTSDGVTIPKVNLRSDIGGYEEVKDQLESEILEILKYKDSLTDPAEIKRIEQIIPRGMLLHGPPGTGKTYFCKGIATELNAALFVVNGPELKSKWVGESEQNIRDVFRKAKENAPALIVFDEIDSFAGQRGGLNNGASQSMVNQLLTEMDGFTKEELVFVVATTNFVESVDSALLRPGRFELKIKIDNPNEYDRGEIIDVYIEKFGLDISDEIRDYIVERTGGFSDMMTGARYTGDHLYAIMRNLMRQDIRARGELVIDRAAIDKAMSKGTKKKADFTQGELRTVTIHEGGHAILSHYLAHSTPTEKISTKSDIPGSLGYVRRGEREEKYIMTEAQMTDDICVLLGGREAERMYIGDVSAGAQDDLQRATMLARAMVEELGMGTGIRVTAGFQVHGRDSKRADISDHQAAEIDKQVEGILQAQKERAVKILKERKKEMKALVKALRKDRVIEKEQIIEILGDPVVAKKPSEDDDWIV
jgi:cell division protease FtsH